MSGVVMSSVGVSYGHTEILSGVSLSVDEGRWMGIIGPNGSGKSTMLKALVGALPHTGSITVADAPVGSSTAKSMARNIAYVPQRPVYPPGMSVFDFVLLGRTPHLGLLAAERAEDIAVVWDSLRSLGISAFAERDVASLSGGETQRVSLARVLAQEAPVVVLDEATASLDVAAQHEVLELIAQIQHEKGVTIVSAMHDLTAAAQFCDELTLLDHGRVVAVGTPEDVLDEPTLGSVFEPTIRVIEIEDTRVVVSLRRQGSLHGK